MQSLPLATTAAPAPTNRNVSGQDSNPLPRANTRAVTTTPKHTNFDAVFSKAMQDAQETPDPPLDAETPDVETPVDANPTKIQPQENAMTPGKATKEAQHSVTPPTIAGAEVTTTIAAGNDTPPDRPVRDIETRSNTPRATSPQALPAKRSHPGPVAAQTDVSNQPAEHSRPRATDMTAQQSGSAPRLADFTPPLAPATPLPPAPETKPHTAAEPPTSTRAGQPSQITFTTNAVPHVTATPAATTASADTQPTTPTPAARTGGEMPRETPFVAKTPVAPSTAQTAFQSARTAATRQTAITVTSPAGAPSPVPVPSAISVSGGDQQTTRSTSAGLKGAQTVTARQNIATASARPNAAPPHPLAAVQPVAPDMAMTKDTSQTSLTPRTPTDSAKLIHNTPDRSIVAAVPWAAPTAKVQRKPSAPQRVVEPVLTSKAPRVTMAPKLQTQPVQWVSASQPGSGEKGTSDRGPSEPMFNTSRAEIPAQQMHTAPNARSELPAQTARQIAEVVAQLPNRPVEVVLSPEELGRVRLTVRPSDTGIVVNVLAERPETLELMRRNIDQLGQDFKGMGYDNIAFSFAGAQSDSQDGDGPPSDNNQAPALHVSSSTLDADATAPQPPANADTGLDLRL